MDTTNHRLLPPLVSFRLYERRRQYREFETFDKTMSLIEYLVTTDPLLSTTLIDWPPRPIETTCPALTHQLISIVPELRSTLRSHGFPDSLMKTACLVSQCIDPQNHDPTEYTPQKLIRIHLDSYNYLPVQLDTCRDAIWNMLQSLGHKDVHIELSYGSSSTNVNLSSEPNSQMPKVNLAIELARLEVLEILEEYFPGKLSGLVPYLTRQYGLPVPTVVVAVQPSSHANWLKLRQLILRELQKYTKMFLEVEFYGYHMVVGEEV
ncbi:uncharacterized protein N7496_004840 [Penicillium cataractarum]|uniref:Uncharacterized protein n=1 Tax=Penicillium cataractarum TaxID=2100454 RepID=A0A9W9SF31_9EURO|nr:uncharacterized protein N7496_004840 [Penicillium cataractarum]KAJ5377431.1 hypothetical protein N7496_004840 [Penicillium cataractarum]